jgi:hypothetical protein
MFDAQQREEALVTEMAAVAVLVRQGRRAGVDFMKTFRPKFTDNLLKFVSTVFMTS